MGIVVVIVGQRKLDIAQCLALAQEAKSYKT